MFDYQNEQKLLSINLGFIKIRLTLDFEKKLIKELKFFLTLLDLVIPKQQNKIVTILYPKQENKTDAYLDWVKESHPEYDCVRITENQDDVSEDNKIYKFYTFRALWELYRAKYIVIANSRFILDYLKSEKHTYVNFWHGMPIKNVGLTDSDTIKNKNVRKRLDFIGKKFLNFVPSDIFKHLMCSAYGGIYQNLYITGLPITDIIMSDKSNNKMESFFNFEGYNKTIFYLPTFKTNALCHAKQINREYDNIFYFDNFDNTKFVEFLEKNNLLFIMKPHPLDEDFYRKNKDTLPVSNNFKIVYDEDFKKHSFSLYELLRYTDLMVSDFSSVTLDYLIINRPVIYLDNLTADYSQNRGMILPDNYELFMPGHKVKTYFDLEDKILKSLFEDDMRTLREKTIPLIHKYQDNKASERIFKIMTKGQKNE